MQLVVEVERRNVTLRTLPFAEEDLFATQLAFGRSLANETAGRRIKFRCRWEVEHILHLSHVTHLDAIENIHALLDHMNLIPVEVRRSLFELGKVLDRPEASLRAVDLLILKAAQADGVDSEPAFLRTNIGSKVELPSCVAVDVAIHARYSKAGGCRLAVVSGIELFLGKWRQQQPHAVQLDRGQNIFEEPVIVVDRDDFPA